MISRGLAGPAASFEAAELASNALQTLHRLDSARREIQLLEGAHLEFLFSSGAFRSFGFASFGDFVREVLHKSPRTARRQIALRRLVVECPVLAQVLAEGRLSPCQALALRPLLGTEDLEPWLALAADCSVADLEQAVLERTGNELEEEPGRRIRFAAPRSAALAWDHGIEWARRMLGWHAPKFLCLEAILSEASSVWMGSEGTEQAVSGRTRADRAAEIPPNPAQAERVDELPSRTVNAILACLRDADRALAALSGPDEGIRSGHASVGVLQHLRGTDRSLRLLFVRLLKELELASLLPLLGYRTPRQLLIREFKVSERTAARLLSEAWLFEGNPRLREAFQQGTIGLGQAYLIDRVAHPNAVRPFIERARGVTHLYFEREVHFLERLREFAPGIAQHFPGPLPSPGLEAALHQALHTLGWTEEAVARELKDHLGWSEPAVDEDPSQDPAVNPFVLRRLESLLEILVLALEGQDTNSGLAPSLTANSIPVSAQCALGALPTLAAAKTTISIWAPESVLHQWNRALGAIQSRHGPLPVWAASILLLAPALQEWRKVDPRLRPASHRIQERDEWRCQAPGCSARRRLESHHIIFRSQTGSDDPENLVTLCHGHHRHGIHDGLLRVSGTAPSTLRWELGTMREVWTGNKRSHCPD